MGNFFKPLGRLGARDRSVIVHAWGSWYASITAGTFDFFDKLGQRALAEGVASYSVPFDSRRSRALLSQDHIHILTGLNTANTGAALFAMPSYVWGFWYLDPKGVHWNSSLAAKAFVPDNVDAGAAEYFFNGVSGYMTRENLSKFPQSHRRALNPAKAVIFLQEIDKYRRPVHYLTSEQMIRTVAQSIDGTVYVKLHPAQSPGVAQRYRDLCAGFPHVEITYSSIHDLIAASEVVVTQNSAAGFEALMQKKPVITCGQTDYHHATLVARTEGALRDALGRAVVYQADFPFERYFYWFLGLHMLEPQKDDFADRAWDRVTLYLNT